jgi:hypothetical protein
MPSTSCYVCNISHNKVAAFLFIFQRKCNKLLFCLRETVTSVPWMSYILSRTLAGFLRISDCSWQDSHCRCKMSLSCFMTTDSRSPHGAAVRLPDIPCTGTCDAPCKCVGKILETVYGTFLPRCCLPFVQVVFWDVLCVLLLVVCIDVSCLVCIVVSCLVCIVVVVLCVLL